MEMLHLLPAGGIDVAWTPSRTGSTAELVLGSVPGQATFGALRSWLERIEPLAGEITRRQLESVRTSLARVAPLSSHGVAQSGILTSGMAFAILRRISRESIHTAQLIDGAARVLAAGVHDAGIRTVLVTDVDRLDRPSLKVLFRVALVSAAVPRQHWVWSFGGDPARSDGSIWADSRHRLLAFMRRTLKPNIDREFAGPLRLFVDDLREVVADGDELAADLVLQNYDRIFALVSTRDYLPVSAIDRVRLVALSALNVGDFRTAEGVLAKGERLEGVSVRRAHLAYLQGLVAAKRHYDLDASDAHHLRGLADLGAGFSAEADLERAWLLNGLALNDALRWRRAPETQNLAFQRAFRRVQRAFEHVAGIDGPSAAYLRFNLVANTTFLLEMGGAFEAAARSFERTFEVGTASDVSSAALAYRIGVLWMRAGHYAKARGYLERAELEAAGDWASQEVVLRALGELAVTREALGEAVVHHAQGARLCLAARARRGVVHHIRSLSVIAPESREHIELRDEVHASGVPEVELTAEVADRAPSKLPAYVPEVDLENLPAIDLNRYLSQGGRDLPPAEEQLDA